jgi:hypothetical protein
MIDFRSRWAFGPAALIPMSLSSLLKSAVMNGSGNLEQLDCAREHRGLFFQPRGLALNESEQFGRLIHRRRLSRPALAARLRDSRRTSVTRSGRCASGDTRAGNRGSSPDVHVDHDWDVRTR